MAPAEVGGEGTPGGSAPSPGWSTGPPRGRHQAMVFPFTHDHRLDATELRSLLGGKGASLHVMASVLGLPVPPGFTVTTQVCRQVLDGQRPPGLDDEVSAHLTALEVRTGRTLGGARPLLVSVRSGAPSSMPGMTDTVLNVGLNPAVVEALARETGSRAFALDCYRRFVSRFGVVVLGVPAASFDHLSGGGGGVAELEAAIGHALATVEGHIGGRFPTDPRQQLDLAMEAVFASWESPRARLFRRREGLSEGLGTAVSVQAMVFGNLDDRSGTGVAFSRHPVTGAPGLVGDFQRCAQGDEVVGGGGHPQPLEGVAVEFPEVWHQLQRIVGLLERWYRDVVDIEFTIEHDRLWMLQARVGERSARGRVRSLVDLAAEGLVTRAEAVAGIEPAEAERILAELQVTSAAEVAGRGVAASPGRVTGEAVFSADEAAAAAGEGRTVVLIRPETSPDDVHGMAAAVGIATAAGGMVSHAAIVARAWGKPAVCGVDGLVVRHDRCEVGGRTIRRGEPVTVDGTAGVLGTGQVRGPLAPLPAELITLAAWSDDVRGAALAPRAVATRLERGDVPRPPTDRRPTDERPTGAAVAGGAAVGERGPARLGRSSAAEGGGRAVLTAEDGRWEVVLLSVHGVDHAAAEAASRVDLAVLCSPDPAGVEAAAGRWPRDGVDAQPRPRWEREVVQRAVGRLRARTPGLRIAAWGVLPSEVEQLGTLLRAGVDEVWCPPMLLPAMKLGTAHAALISARAARAAPAPGPASPR